MACERRGIPWIVGDLFPMLVPTATGPPSGMPDLGGTVNQAMWRLGRSRLVDPLTSRRAFVNFRRRLGLATDRRWNVVDARLSPHHNIALVSAHYVAPAADWPSNYRLVGFTSWSGPDPGRLPEEVERFLDDGPPPVAVTLGTSGATARPDVFERVADALFETRTRGVFLTSNAAVTDRLRAAIQPLHGVWPFVSSHRCCGPAGSYSPEPTGPTPSRSRPACRRSSCVPVRPAVACPPAGRTRHRNLGHAAGAHPQRRSTPAPRQHTRRTGRAMSANWPPNTEPTPPATRSKPSCPPPDSRRTHEALELHEHPPHGARTPIGVRLVGLDVVRSCRSVSPAERQSSG